MHPAVKKLVEVKSKADGPLNLFGAKITLLTGTMYVAFVFAILSFISLPQILATGSVILIIQWITQSFLQLVLLPIIIVGQNQSAAASEARDIEQAREVRVLFDNLEAANAKRHQQTHAVLDAHTAALKVK